MSNAVPRPVVCLSCVLTLLATLEDGSHVSGQLLWMDERFLKLRKPDGAAIVLGKYQLVRIEALDGTAPARVEDVREDRWVRAVPGST